MMTEPTADNAADSDAMTLREHLIEGNFDEAVAGYNHARQQGEADPVVFLVDCEDSIGAEIARAWEGDEAVNDAILDARHGGPVGEGDSSKEAAAEAEQRTAILVRTFPFADCRQEVPNVFPYLADSFRQPPAAGTFLVVVVAADGAATFTAPIA